MSKKFTLAELQSISVKCGLPSTTSRSCQLDSLKKFYAEEVAQFPLIFSRPILSLDLGLRNLAACEIVPLESEGRAYKILQWNKFDLQLPETYNPLKYAENVKKFVQNDLFGSFSGQHIFIERQRHRSGSHSSVLEVIMRLAILEAQLHCYLSEKYQTVPVNPAAVAKFFDLPTGKDKKSAAVVLVKEMLKRGKVLQCTSSLESFFLSQKKQDDLADSLLQAISALEFRKNCREFMEKNFSDKEKEISINQ